MKVGDLVKLKNLHDEWGEVGLVARINITDYGLGQISVIANGNLCTIPWIKRTHYTEAISESR